MMLPQNKKENPSSGNSRCKGPVVGVYLMCSMYNKKFSVARVK